jgi:hypothetical protein
MLSESTDSRLLELLMGEPGADLLLVSENFVAQCLFHSRRDL